MSMDFSPPSYRAASGDLTISISPLGLVELADEEFEVHGPRLNRYALNFAMYLGHHWSHRREMGEQQHTANYYRAFVDYLNRFTFGRGVHFGSAKETEAIVPEILKRVWNEDNDQEKILLEIGQVGSVTGDAFVKVAYEQGWEDSAGRIHPGRVRILPLNSSFCLPEEAEILTRRGWLTHSELTTDDEAASLDPDTKEIVWAPVEMVNVFDWDGPLAHWSNERFDVMSTPEHRWMYRDGRGKESIRTTEQLHDLKHNGGRLVVGGGTSALFSDRPEFSDDFVRIVGWFVTEGHWFNKGTSWQAPGFTQSATVNPDHAAEINDLLMPHGASRYQHEDASKADVWYAPGLTDKLMEVVGEDKRFGFDFLKRLTLDQASILFDTLLKGDGSVHKGTVTQVFHQSHEGRVEDFQTLAMMLGKRTHVRWRQREIGKPCADVTVYQNDTVNLTNLSRQEHHYTGKVWCPTTGTGTWIARYRGITFHTGNCFPEWHPHDRSRLIRMKIKYRFWGCVDTKTEALTRDGWKRYDELTTADEILVLDPDTDEIHWRPVDAVNVYDYEGHMVAWGDRVNAVSTPNHRWLVEQQHGRGDTLRYERKIARTELPIDGDPAVSALRNGSRVVVGGGTPMAFADAPKWSDEAVETLAWYITEGWDHSNQTNTKSIYLAQKRDDMVSRIRRLAAHWQAEGATFSEYAPKSDGVITWYLGKGVKEAMWEMSPDKRITPEFLTSLTYAQAVSFYNTLLDGDGSRSHGGKNTVRWTQLDEGRQDGFQMLCAMLGKRTAKTSDGEKVQEYQSRYVGTEYLNERRVYLEDGKIWCPTVEGGIWFARREGNTYWTGNTSLEGTRQVFTFTEILTDDIVEEYLNDELIDSRPNPLGVIPIVHIPNLPVSGSPWGISDCQDIISINRQFNEISTDVADIINYHAAPVTVITGAKASQLEKGAKKVWAGLPKDASVFNLEGGGSGLQWALQYLETLKRTMHEMVGVPETALGQVQPISNTSGVALSIQFQPLMNRWQQKVAQYGAGLKEVNELVLMTLGVHEPDALVWNPTEDQELEPGQVPVLDLSDPLSFQTTVIFPPPLPLDKLVVLNEIQAKMTLGLESREGALRVLGEEFPDEKLAEIRNELIEDAKTDGALDLVKTQIANEIAAMTGSYPVDNAPMPAQPPMPTDLSGDGVPDALVGPGITQDPEAQLAEQEIRSDLLTRAYGTKLPQRSVPTDGKT